MRLSEPGMAYSVPRFKLDLTVVQLWFCRFFVECHARTPERVLFCFQLWLFFWSVGR